MALIDSNILLIYLFFMLRTCVLNLTEKKLGTANQCNSMTGMRVQTIDFLMVPIIWFVSVFQSL